MRSEHVVVLYSSALSKSVRTIVYMSWKRYLRFHCAAHSNYCPSRLAEGSSSVNGTDRLRTLRAGNIRKRTTGRTATLMTRVLKRAEPRDPLAVHKRRKSEASPRPRWLAVSPVSLTKFRDSPITTSLRQSTQIPFGWPSLFLCRSFLSSSSNHSHTQGVS